MENTNLKDEILKSVQSFENVKACFSIISDSERNNVCVGGFGQDIVNILANSFIESPALLSLVEESLKLMARQISMKGVNKVEDKEDELAKLKQELIKKLTQVLN